MLKSCCLKSTIFILSLFAILSPLGASAAVKFENADIGQAKGGASQVDGNLTVIGTGHGMATSGDIFHFVWRAGIGTQSVEALLLPSENAEAALAIRESTDPQARGVWVGINATGMIQVAYRSSPHNPIRKQSLDVQGKAPLWIRMTRTGFNISIFASEDGLTWRQIHSFHQALPDKLLSGFAAAGKSPGDAIFRSFRVDSSSQEDTDKVLASRDVALAKPPDMAALSSSSYTSSQIEASPAGLELAAGMSYEGLAHLLPEENRGGRLIFVNGAVGADAPADPEAGKVASPMRTVAAALEMAVDGDVLVLMPGQHKISALTPGNKTLVIHPMEGVTISEN